MINWFNSPSFSPIDWGHWHNEPYLVGGIVLLAWFYAILTGPFRSRLAGDEPYPKRQAAYFYSGLAIFYLAVGSPLDQIGEKFLLSAHMIQHQLLIYVSAVLFLVGTPAWLVRPLTARARLHGLFRIISHPISCGVIYTLTLSLWHAPRLYDAALQNKTVHVWEHLMFFGAALFYWWPVLSPSEEFPALRPASQLLYLFAITIGMTPIFAFIAFSDNVLYPTYEYAPRLVARLSPMEDQLLGAAIMKLGSVGVTIIAMIVSFYNWYQISARNEAVSSTQV